ncbi:hypothetical protein chiPu_0027744, partial [Chiloscyllium punctatum]|nr:hypothetical protein [Chiloscyllium punctatum]
MRTLGSGVAFESQSAERRKRHRFRGRGGRTVQDLKRVGPQ